MMASSVSPDESVRYTTPPAALMTFTSVNSRILVAKHCSFVCLIGGLGPFSLFRWRGVVEVTPAADSVHGLLQKKLLSWLSKAILRRSTPRLPRLTPAAVI